MSNGALAILAAVVLACPFAAAETLQIEHSTVACVVADKYPRFEARFRPADAVARARVLFQPKDTAPWYAVAMGREGPVFEGVLPKPKKSLESFRYYIEVTDKAANTTRTADQAVTVVDGAGGCEGMMVAGALGSATVALEVPAGAPAVPAGFASAGIAAATAGAAVTAAAASSGGGVPAAVLIGGAAAAAAGAAVVVSRGGAPKDYSGPINGEYTLTTVCTFNMTTTCTNVFAISGTATVTLEESNGSVQDLSGFQATGTSTAIRVIGAGCSPLGPFPFGRSCRLAGSPGAITCRSESTAEGLTSVTEFSGALRGGVITGTATISDVGRGGVAPGGSCEQTGSGTFTVEMR